MGRWVPCPQILLLPCQLSMQGGRRRREQPKCTLIRGCPSMTTVSNVPLLTWDVPDPAAALLFALAAPRLMCGMMLGVSGSMRWAGRISELMMLSPGANKVTAWPKLEPEGGFTPTGSSFQRRLWMLDAPTQMTLGTRPGEDFAASSCSFPAAA